VVITDSGRPECAILTVSHMAVDLWSLHIAGEDLTVLLRGDALPASAQQPLDRAVWEASQAGQRTEGRSLGHWARRIPHVAPAMLEPLPGSEGELDWVSISSPAMAQAAHELATTAEVDPATAVLAASAHALAAVAASPDVALRLIVATRFRPETRRLVAAFNQNALLCLDTSTGLTPEFLRNCANETVTAYRYCECDPRKLERLVADLAAERGLASDAYCFFNDARAGHERGLGRAFHERGLGRAFSRSSAAQTAITGIKTEKTPKGSKFFLFLNSLADTCVMTVCADRRFLYPSTAREFLLDVEARLIAAADSV